jgi:cell division protein FtsB
MRTMKRFAARLRLPWIVAAVAAGSLLLALAVVDAGSPDGTQVERLQGELDRLESVNAGLHTRNLSLARQVKSLKENPALLEHNVREDLGFIRDGEVVVVLPR